MRYLVKYKTTLTKSSACLLARVVFVNATVHFPEGSLEFETVLLRDSHDNQSILFLFFLQLLLLVLLLCRFFFFYFCCRQHQVSPRNSLLSTHKIASLLGLMQYIKMAQPSCISCTHSRAEHADEKITRYR